MTNHSRLLAFPSCWRSVCRSLIPHFFLVPLADMYSMPQPAASFVLDSVRMHYDDAGLFEDWIDDWCTYMGNKRLPLTHLELVGNGLQRRNVLPLLRREFLSTSRPKPLKELTLRVPRGDFAYPGLFSLLALCSDVKTLRLQRANEIGSDEEYEEQAHQRVWRWLGFLLFSLHSNAAFHTLENTDMDLSVNNAQEISAIRETNNTFQLLHPRLSSTGHSQPPRTVRIIENIREVVPILNVQVEEKVEDEDEEAERTMWISVNWLPLSHGVASYPVFHDEESGSAVDILIAGYGVVLVDRAKVEFAPATLKADTRPSCSVRHLNIVLDANDADKANGLMAFVEMFGETLESLSIRATGRWILDATSLHEIVDACPNLTCLALDGMHLESWAPLIDVYETGQCHARVLQLRHCYVGDSPEALRVASTNPEPKIVQCVRELTVDVPDMGQASGLFMAQELFELLQSNQTLQYVDFGVSVVFLSPIGMMLDSFHGKIIMGKLPIKSKLAFLGVVTPKNDEIQASSCTELDSLAISRIFEFAGEYMRRTVSVGPCLPVHAHSFFFWLCRR